MGGGEYEDVAFVVNGYHRIVVCVVCPFVEEDGRLWHRACFMVVVRDHVQEFSVAVFGCAAVAEEGLFDLVTIDGEGLVLGAVCAETAAVLIDVLVAGRLIHIPDAAIAVVFGVNGYCGRDGSCSLAEGKCC